MFSSTPEVPLHLIGLSTEHCKLVKCGKGPDGQTKAQAAQEGRLNQVGDSLRRFCQSPLALTLQTGKRWESCSASCRLRTLTQVIPQSFTCHSHLLWLDLRSAHFLRKTFTYKFKPETVQSSDNMCSFTVQQIAH